MDQRPAGQAGAQGAGRGFDPADARLFGAGALPLLTAAQAEIQFLLDRGYPADSVISLVGSHHQLAARQRLALQRSTSPQLLVQRRQASLLPWSAAADGPMLIDGFNLIITLEVALCGNILLRGGDGALRDLAGLRGTYRVIPETSGALQLLGETLQELQVPGVLIYLDAPVSNSGRLRAAIGEAAAGWGLPAAVRLAANVDRELTGQARIVSSDSLLLDRSLCWFNLAQRIIARHVPQAWVVDLSGHRATD
jgi:hypothetical protein